MLARLLDAEEPASQRRSYQKLLGEGTLELASNNYLYEYNKLQLKKFF